ncbi:MAG: hypothetical protein IJ574_00475 [Bacilli bacterium]|nr:hypothetical protein [Bacilli bacterium]
MYDNINCPIKYAVLELKEQGGFADNYEYQTKGYAVSKCYVLESKLKYLPNGDTKEEYNVFFPYKSLSWFKHSLKIFHNPNLGNPREANLDRDGSVTNGDIVTAVFDTYEEAKKLADELNKELEIIARCEVSIADENYKSKIVPYIEKYQKEQAICEQFEQLAEELNKDMVVTKSDIKVKNLRINKNA